MSINPRAEGMAAAAKAQSLPRFTDPFSSVFSTLQAGDASAGLLLIGDSTGDEDGDWLYRLLTEKVGPALPGIRIHYRSWNDTNQDYDGWRVLQAGGAERGVVFLGTSFRQLTTAEVGARSSADFEVRFRMAADNWKPASQARLVGQFTTAGNQAWYITLETSGSIAFRWTADGSTAKVENSSVPPFVNGTAYDIRCRFISNNGGGGYTVTTDYSTDRGATWTNICNAVRSAGTSTIFTGSTADYQLGEVSGVGNWTGTFYEIEIRDGIAGKILNPQPIESWGSADSSNSLINSLTGVPTLYVWNGSQSGQGVAYFSDSTRLPKVAVPCPFQTVFISTSHNDAGLRFGKLLTDAWASWMSALKSRLPSANFVVLNQNPRNMAQSFGQSFGEDHDHRCHVLPGVAAQNGAVCIDTYRAFIRAVQAGDTLANLVSDGKHPTKPQGVNVWVNEVWRAMTQRQTY